MPVCLLVKLWIALFLIKIFNVIVSLLTMLGFYAYMPDIRWWLRIQPEFPFKQNLLQLDAQTLQLVVFAFLLFVVLAKVNLRKTKNNHIFFVFIL